MSRRVSLKPHGSAVAPRLTVFGAALIGLAVALPSGVVLMVLDWALF